MGTTGAGMSLSAITGAVRESVKLRPRGATENTEGTEIEGSRFFFLCVLCVLCGSLACDRTIAPMKRIEPVTRPRALLLDMDGTITEPMLDFPRIKREMGMGTRPILEALAEMNDTDRATAEAVLAQHEEEAAQRSSLNAGCDRLLAWIA